MVREKEEGEVVEVVGGVVSTATVVGKAKGEEEGEGRGGGADSRPTAGVTNNTTIPN